MEGEDATEFRGKLLSNWPLFGCKAGDDDCATRSTAIPGSAFPPAPATCSSMVEANRDNDNTNGWYLAFDGTGTPRRIFVGGFAGSGVMTASGPTDRLGRFTCLGGKLTSAIKLHDQSLSPSPRKGTTEANTSASFSTCGACPHPSSFTRRPFFTRLAIPSICFMVP